MPTTTMTAAVSDLEIIPSFRPLPLLRHFVNPSMKMLMGTLFNQYQITNDELLLAVVELIYSTESGRVKLTDYLTVAWEIDGLKVVQILGYE